MAADSCALCNSLATLPALVACARSAHAIHIMTSITSEAAAQRLSFDSRPPHSDEYRERMRSEPAFTAAVDAFGEAWKATGR
jgi:hypothetical protein